MSKEKLVIYVPGITMTTAQWQPLIENLQKDPDLSYATWIGWDHNCGIFSTSDILRKSSELNAVIDAEWRKNSGYKEITLVGHSFGGILVRVAYLLASGCYENEPKSVWAEYVTSFVLLAAVNRGLDQTKFNIKVYDDITRLLGLITFNRFLGQDFIAGSEFITDLRIRWIRHMRLLESNKLPSVYQILGTKDSVVTRSDSIDLEQFPNAVHISIPEADHRVLPLIQEGPNRKYRFETIKNCVLGKEIPQRDKTLVFKKSSNVVFILHGIRAANRGWVQSLRKKIGLLLPDSEVVTPSYGYLSALEFALPFLHRRPIREFQQLYSDYFIQNPGANFHFVGHSNGTYVLGWSLQALPSMQFNRVALAGSVLPRNFPWKILMDGEHPQVKKLRNDCANEDVPVSFLCSGLKGLGRHDVGTGGYDGFFYDDNKVVQYWYHNGGHGAALSEENLANIADYIVGKDSETEPEHLSGEKGPISFLSRLAPWIFRALVLLVSFLVIAGFLNKDIELLIGAVVTLLVSTLLLKIL